MRLLKIKCDGCAALAINGVACHEQGCYQESRPWIEIDGYVVPATHDNYEDLEE